MLQLICIGLVAAATTIFFGVASVLLVSQVPLTEPYRASYVWNYSNANIPAVPRPTYSPALDAAKILPALPPKDASEPERAKASLELPSLDRDASTTAGEAEDVSLGRDVLITKPRTIERSATEPAAPEGRPIADGVGTSTPIGGRAGLSHSLDFQQDQPANLSQDNLATGQTTPQQNGQDQRIHRHLLSSNAAFRSRVQRECGSIIFPALRRHCIASFGSHYR